MDVILVKHFFNPYTAGLYAALSTLGKIIFFAFGAVSAAMFPIVVDLHEREQEHKNVLRNSLAIVSVGGAVILFLYFFLPKLVIRLLFGSAYLSVASLLGFFGVFTFLLSLASIFVYYFLSINKINFVFLLVLASLAEIIGIYLFHSSLLQVVLVLNVVTSLLLISLVLFYLLVVRIPRQTVDAEPKQKWDSRLGVGGDACSTLLYINKLRSDRNFIRVRFVC
jgi:O-antigen/teichoic acid export membrane protein